MTDIVERLRLLESGARWMCAETADTLEDAADEIERLRAECQRLAGEVSRAHKDALTWMGRAAAARREGIEAAVKWHEAKASWWSQGADAVTRQPDLSEQEAAARAIEFRENAAEHQGYAAAIRALLEDGR